MCIRIYWIIHFLLYLLITLHELGDLVGNKLNMGRRVRGNFIMYTLRFCLYFIFCGNVFYGVSTVHVEAMVGVEGLINQILMRM